MSNGTITGDTLFIPVLSSGPGPEPGNTRDLSRIGWEGHAGFTWTYYENEFPIDFGWD